MAAGGLQLPPGFRFHPTDDELVMHYLCRKCASQSIAVPIIAEIDLYRFDPWLLPGMALYGEKEWYFFSPRDRKYPNGSRPNRAAGSGYWKATGADKPIGKPKAMGIKKALVFYAGKAPKGEKTNWIMHEYRLADVDRSARKKNNSLRLDDWVLCRIYNKKGAVERGARSSPAPPVEGKIRKTDQVPLEGAGEEKPAVVLAPVLPKSDHTYFDSSDSFPRMHTSDSSCSEGHVASQEMKCEREVQSERRWRGWENTVEIPTVPSVQDSLLGFGSNVANQGGFLQFDYPQLSPLYNPCHDPFSFLLKPF